MTFKVLDLFSGIGSYSLGLERTGGFETVAFCESDPYCRKILAKHWPSVKCYEDVSEVTGARLRADGIAADFIAGGWPCQGISVAGAGRGLDDPRSGLWAHIPRIARDIRAKGLLLENSSNLLAINGGRDFGQVLGDLAALGYHVEWHCLSAAAFDAPHIRDRLWIVGLATDAASKRRPRSRVGLQPVHSAADCNGETDQPIDDREITPNASRNAGPGQSSPARTERERIGASGEPIGAATADGDGSRQQQSQGRWTEKRRRISDRHPQHAADADSIAPIGAAIARAERNQWEPEPGLARVVSGIANRVDRIRALGNTNPPQIPEAIGRAILEAAA